MNPKLDTSIPQTITSSKDPEHNQHLRDLMRSIDRETDWFAQNPVELHELSREELESLEAKLESEIELLQQDLEEKEDLAELVSARLEEPFEEEEEEEEAD